MIVCQNCGSEGDQKYCPGCGQALVAERISIQYLFHEVAHTFWHLEKGFIYIKRAGNNPGNAKIFIGVAVALSKAIPLVCYLWNILCTCLIYYLPKCTNTK
jgi:hypothetical protein